MEKDTLNPIAIRVCSVFRLPFSIRNFC